MKFLNLFYLADTPFTETELFHEGLLGMLGAVFAAAGFIYLLRVKHLTATGVVVTGFIYDYEREADNDGYAMYYPIVRFLTRDDKRWITGRLTTCTSWQGEKGGSIEIIYDPLNPIDFLENSGTAKNVVPVIFITGGIAGFVFCILELLGVINFI